ncbi:putative short chain dehydrogenase [Colletotrichum sublineola]|uniref:Putative short chain dehydrogenase n=1 Tax=Colletotrichum sublineola TaxID=1173701 RepID=A0A066X3J9_COLSU|nr:putative short chain dehydrogenase [Colletotrichum sublineola]
MQPPLPSVTPTWRNDTYDAISPSRPELSAAGKTIIVIGAKELLAPRNSIFCAARLSLIGIFLKGSGIGRETALAFASAGAARVILLGRTEAAIAETAASLPTSVQSDAHAVDITNEEALTKVAAAAGQWDVLVLTAGYVSSPSPVTASASDEWWQSFEVSL